MFDPERDVDHTSRRFYLRILAVLAISVVGCVALFPSVTSFPAGVDGKGCLAVADGWHADRPAPSANDRAIEASAGPYSRTSGAEEQILTRVYAYDDWRAGPGVCVPESRHRLILSAIGLTPLLLGFAAAGIIRRARSRRERACIKVPQKLRNPNAGSF